MCTLILPPGGNPIAVNKYIIFCTHPVACFDVGLRLQAQCTERLILKLLSPGLAGCVLHVPQSLRVNIDGFNDTILIEVAHA